MATTVTPTTGAGVFDGNLMFISSGNVTRGTTTAKPSSGLKIRGTPIGGLAARISFPSGPGTTCRVLPAIQVSADDSTYRTIAQYPGGYLSWTKSTAKEVMLPFEMLAGYPYVKLIFYMANGSTGSSYGAVKAGITVRAHGDWHRDVRWG